MIVRKVFQINYIFTFFAILTSILLLYAAIYMQFIIDGREFGWNVFITLFFISIAVLFWIIPFAKIILSETELQINIGKIKRRRIYYNEKKYLTKSTGLLTGYIIAIEKKGRMKTVYIPYVWESSEFLYQLKMRCKYLSNSNYYK